MKEAGAVLILELRRLRGVLAAEGRLMDFMSFSSCHLEQRKRASSSTCASDSCAEACSSPGSAV